MAENQSKLLKELTIRHNLRTEEIMQLLNVSRSTVRRIIIDLESTGRVTRFLNGVALNTAGQMTFKFEEMLHEAPKDKQAIGHLAVNHIKENDCVFVGAGTTCVYAALKLAELAMLEKLKSITVVTNSLVVFNAVARLTNVTLIGGKFRYSNFDFIGHIAENQAQRLHFDKCIMGADGISEDGFSSKTPEGAAMAKLVMKNSAKSIMITDSSKFLRPSFIAFAPLKDADIIITDENIPLAMKEKLTQNNVKIEYSNIPIDRTQ